MVGGGGGGGSSNSWKVVTKRRRYGPRDRIGTQDQRLQSAQVSHTIRYGTDKTQASQ